MIRLATILRGIGVLYFYVRFIETLMEYNLTYGVISYEGGLLGPSVCNNFVGLDIS